MNAGSGGADISAGYLVQLTGDSPGLLYPLTNGAHSIGRGMENAFCIMNASVSRQHAIVWVDPHTGVRISDLGSTNGTYRNGGRLSARGEQRLDDGDLIRFGAEIVVKYTRPDPTEIEAQRELFERAVRDPLTGLFNRRYFLERTRRLIHTDGFGPRGLALLMVDIDHFKRINDRHGHDGGDAVLREIAEVLRVSTRSDDLVARYGGEEFILALPNVTMDLARRRGERIRAAIEARAVTVGQATVDVTASVGIAFVPSTVPSELEPLIAAADRALYAAKDSGRNRVVLCSENALSELRTTVDDEP
jgi:diguanylate cyclase (GGDEF)-like protein